MSADSRKPKGPPSPPPSVVGRPAGLPGTGDPPTRSSTPMWIELFVTALSLAGAWGLMFGGTHWAWWALALGGLGTLAWILVRKLSRIRSETGAIELPCGNVRRPAGTPSGRKTPHAQDNRPET